MRSWWMSWGRIEVVKVGPLSTSWGTMGPKKDSPWPNFSVAGMNREIRPGGMSMSMSMSRRWTDERFACPRPMPGSSCSRERLCR